MAKKAFAWLSAAKLSMHGEQKTDNVYWKQMAYCIIY